MFSTAARRLVLAGLAASVAATVFATASAQAAPPPPGSVPYINFGDQARRVGSIELSVGNPGRVQASNDWVTQVKVCNRGTTDLPVGVDTFSYTNRDNATRWYEPSNGYLASELPTSTLRPGSCASGGLLNRGQAPAQMSFHNVGADTRVDILPATEWEAIFKVSHPTSAGAFKEYGDWVGDRRADVAGLSGTKVLVYRTREDGTLALQRDSGARGTYNWFAKIGDVDSNGYSDILARDTAGTMWLQRMMENGRAGVRTRVGTNFNGMTLMTTVGDITGDGLPELITRHADGNLYRYSMTRKGFQGGVKIGQNWNNMTKLIGLSSNGDTSELLAISKDGLLHRYPLSAKGAITGHAVVGRGWSSMRLVTSPGRLDLNGSDDLIAVRNDGHLYSYANLGNGRWGVAKKIGQNWGAITQLA